MIPVSQPFLPPLEEYNDLISRLWDTKWVTNNGAFVQELEEKLQLYLNVSSLHYVSNGTTALQLAIKALDIKGEVITTPFSFVATATAIIWENCTPVFIDIDPKTLCIDAEKIEEAVTEKTAAILATHVFGIPCNVERIGEIAKKYNLKVIYDAAHAFGVKYKNKSLVSFGDLSIISFHATKLFHTIEGGAIVNNLGTELEEKIKMLRNFGMKENEHYIPGINGKNSEFHAAMGLCNLKYITDILIERKELTDLYDILLQGKVISIRIPENVDYNYSYYPIIFNTSQQLQKVNLTLEMNKILSRRYFFPSLNELNYLHEKYICPISEDISRRILCLPLFNGLTKDTVEFISKIVLKSN